MAEHEKRRERKKPVRYVTPSFRESGHAEYGDPAEHGYPNHMEAPFAGFFGVHLVRLLRRETVGSLFAFGNWSFDLRADQTRDAILVENQLTGERLFIPRQNILTFFWDSLPKFHISQTWNHWEEQPPGTAASALESRRSRAPFHDTDQEFRRRGGRPGHRSQFKYPNGGKRIR